MSADDLDALLARMEHIAKAVNTFSSEAVQIEAFGALIAAFRGGDGPTPPRQNDTDDGPETGEDAQSSNGERKRSRRSARKARSSQSSDSSGVDETAIANAVKEHEKFELFNKKIILGSASKTEQVKFVSWFADPTPLTSGNMRRVLEHLGVRISAPQASTAVTNAKSDYIVTPGSTPKTFKLSARAKEDFEKWLLNDTTDK